MYPNAPKILLLLLSVFIFSKTKAQSVICNGSLGDPVLKYTFGAGSNYGPPLGTDITTFTYVQACPEDGEYTLVNNTNIKNGANCHPGIWQTLTHDHTGDPNGYMMLINASRDASKFFTYKIPDGVLCPDTKYEFSAFILNLITQINAGPRFSKPDIVFSITQADGTVFTYDTKNIPESTGPDDWLKYSMPFRTPPGNTAITLEMTNKSPGGTGNDLVLDDIEFRACGPAIPVGFDLVGNTQAKPACAGDNTVFHLVANPGTGYDDPKFQWQSSYNSGVTWTDVPGKTSTTYDFMLEAGKPAGTYQYRLAVAEGSNINSLNCRTYSGALTINLDVYPDVPEVKAVPACIGEPFTLSASGGGSYEWVGPGITPANKNQQNPVIDDVTAADAGVYQVFVKSAGGCIRESNKVTITVDAKPVISIAGPSQVCSGTPVVLQAYAPNAKTYSWLPVSGVSDPSSANPTFSPTQTTTYTVTVTNNGGCTDSKEVTLQVVPSPIVTVSPAIKLFEGKTVVLDARQHDATTYLWTPAIGLDDATKLNPVASPTDDITYTVKASSDNGCEPAYASIFVKVFKKINIPTIFTPNGDGVNDTWNIEALNTYPQCQLKVFNRNGQEVFSSTGYGKQWTGGYNGYVLPSGTYYYIIDLKIGTPVLSGWVYIAH